jgi:hypothetical protein
MTCIRVRIKSKGAQTILDSAPDPNPARSDAIVFDCGGGGARVWSAGFLFGEEGEGDVATMKGGDERILVAVSVLVDDVVLILVVATTAEQSNLFMYS